MSRKLTVAYIEEIVAAFNSRDVDAIAAYFTEDCTFYPSRGPEIVGARIRGRAAVRQYLADRFKLIPDMRWDPVYDYVADDTHAVSVWIVRGKHVNGEVIERQGVDLWEFRDGLVHNKDTYWKVVEPA
jgi:ketosteroid isomerase-like protein